jgi:hypothetical protein
MLHPALDASSGGTGDASWNLPRVTAELFWDALKSPDEFRDLLWCLISPESQDEWGDFSDVAVNLDAYYVWGDGAEREVAPGVVEVRLACDDGAGLAEDAPILTLVRRPSLGGWVVHHLGDHVPLDAIPTD